MTRGSRTTIVGSKTLPVPWVGSAWATVSASVVAVAEGDAGLCLRWVELGLYDEALRLEDAAEEVPELPFQEEHHESALPRAKRGSRTETR